MRFRAAKRLRASNMIPTHGIAFPPSGDPRASILSTVFRKSSRSMVVSATSTGLSKLIADASCQEYAQAYDLSIVVNRFGVLSGAGQFGHMDQGWVVWWAIAHWFQLPLTYLGWQGKQVRDVLFVEDMLRLLDLQMEQIATFPRRGVQRGWRRGEFRFAPRSHYDHEGDLFANRTHYPNG